MWGRVALIVSLALVELYAKLSRKWGRPLSCFRLLHVVSVVGLGVAYIWTRLPQRSLLSQQWD